MTQNHVEIRDLVKTYPGVLAVDGVDLDLRGGEVVGLLGKNGAGKSTVIKVLVGAERADSGSILLNGELLPEHYGPHDAHDLGIVAVHQELAMVPHMSVAENVALGSRLPRWGGVLVARRQVIRAVRRVLADLDPTIDPARKASELTSVQQRLVMIARALYHDARVLILDEPSASLTPAEISHLHAVVRTLRDQGRAVLYVSHRLPEVLAITDRVVVMRDAKVVFEHPTAGLEERVLVSAIVGEETALVVGRRHESSATQDADVLLRVTGLRAPHSEDSVSFELHAGEILGLGGLTGSGRTEIVRMLFGADPIGGGKVVLRGEPIEIGSPSQAIQAGIALLPEDRRHQGLVPTFGVRQNTTLASLRAFRLSRRIPIPSRRREASATRRLVEKLQIRTPSVEQPVRYLSGGNQQKVVLAKWLDLPVDVFLFDEATQGIDVHAKEEIFELVEQLAADGNGVIFISSDFSELAAICHRVLGVRDGILSGALTGAELTEQAITQLSYEQIPAGVDASEDG